MEPKGLLQIQGQTSLVRVSKETGQGLKLPKNLSKKTMELFMDLVLYWRMKDEVLFCLNLLKVAHPADPL